MTKILWNLSQCPPFCRKTRYNQILKMRAKKNMYFHRYKHAWIMAGSQEIVMETFKFCSNADVNSGLKWKFITSGHRICPIMPKYDKGTTFLHSCPTWIVLSLSYKTVISCQPKRPTFHRSSLNFLNPNCHSGLNVFSVSCLYEGDKHETFTKEFFWTINITCNIHLKGFHICKKL